MTTIDKVRRITKEMEVDDAIKYGDRHHQDLPLFLLDVAFRHETNNIYLKFLNKNLQCEFLTVQQNGLGIFLVIDAEYFNTRGDDVNSLGKGERSDDGCMVSDNSDDSGGDDDDYDNDDGGKYKRDKIKERDIVEIKRAALQKILQYAFPQYSFTFTNIGVLLNTLNKNLYELLLKNKPNFGYGPLFKLDVTGGNGYCRQIDGIGGHVNNVQNLTNVTWRERECVVKFLLDNASTQDNLYAITALNRKIEYVFLYDLLINNIQEYHQDELGSVDEGARMDGIRAVHSIPYGGPLERPTQFWSPWSLDGFPDRNYDEYTNKCNKSSTTTTTTMLNAFDNDVPNPLFFVPFCTVCVDGGRKQINSPHLTEIGSIVVLTGNPNSKLRFLWIYTTQKQVEHTDKWRNIFSSLYTDPASSFNVLYFQDEATMLSLFVAEMSKSAFVPDLVSFHILYGYDLYHTLWLPVMGRLMDLKLFSVVGEWLIKDIFENSLLFTKECIVFDIKQLLLLLFTKDSTTPSLVKDGLWSKKLYKIIQLDESLQNTYQSILERLNSGGDLMKTNDDNNGATTTTATDTQIKQKQISLASMLFETIVLDRVWCTFEFIKLGSFMAKMLKTPIRDLFGCLASARSTLYRKIQKNLPNVLHYESLEWGRYGCQSGDGGRFGKTILNDFNKLQLSCNKEKTVFFDTEILYQMPKLNFKTTSPILSDKHLRLHSKQLWKEGNDSFVYLRIDVQNAYASICDMYNVSFENTAILPVQQLLDVLGIYVKDTVQDGNAATATHYTILRGIDETRKYVRCTKPEDCHELFEAMFTHNGMGDEYTVNTECFRMLFYDSEDLLDAWQNQYEWKMLQEINGKFRQMPGQEISTLDQLLAIKNPNKDRIFIIFDNFRGTLPLIMRKVLHTANNIQSGRDSNDHEAADGCEQEDMYLSRQGKCHIMGTLTDAMVESFANKRGPTYFPPLKNVCDILIKTCIYNIIEGVDDRTHPIIIYKHYLLLKTTKAMETTIIHHIQSRADSLYPSNSLQFVVNETYDAVLVINQSLYITFSNIRNRGKNYDGDGSDGIDDTANKYQIDIHNDPLHDDFCCGEEEKEDDPTTNFDYIPPAIEHVIKYMCDWVYFTKLDDQTKIQSALEALFTSAYLYLFRQTDQTQFGIVAKEDERPPNISAQNFTPATAPNTDVDNLLDKVCEKHIFNKMNELRTKENAFDGVIFPISIFPPTFDKFKYCQESFDHHTFRLYFMKREEIEQINKQVARKSMAINYYFFLKRYKKIICHILDKHKSIYKRFVRREELAKNDALSFIQIIDQMLAETFIYAVHEVKHGGSGATLEEKFSFEQFVN